jgi:putative transposase
MTDFIRGSSSYTRLEEHVCFKAKYCHRVFDYPAFRVRCEEIFREVAEEQNVVIHEMGFDGDHVHMDWQIRPVHSLSKLAKAFKGRSGRKLLDEFPQFKREFFWGSGLWAPTIFGDTVGRDPDQIKTYIREQGKKPRLLPGQQLLASFSRSDN